MDASTLMREARRHTGLSQRDFADVTGIAVRTLTKVENGQAGPGWVTLQRAAETAGLTLAWVPQPPPASPEVRRFLSHSTGVRLRMALWAAARRADTRFSDLEGELAALSRRWHVHLTGPTAVPLWVQGVVSPDPLRVRCHEKWSGLLVDPEPVHVDVELAPGPLPEPLVRLGVRGSRVLFADDPAALARREDCATWAPMLREAARVLLEDPTRDRGGRRRPVHREPDERREAGYLFHVKGFQRFALPDDRDSRSWRFGGEVSLQQWTEQGRREQG